MAAPFGQITIYRHLIYWKLCFHTYTTLILTTSTSNHNLILFTSGVLLISVGCYRSSFHLSGLHRDSMDYGLCEDSRRSPRRAVVDYTGSCFEARSFESCWNFLLYLALQFFAYITTKLSLTVSKITVPWYTNIISEASNFESRGSGKKWDPNKFGTHKIDLNIDNSYLKVSTYNNTM